jgi:hypothetical protein
VSQEQEVRGAATTADPSRSDGDDILPAIDRAVDSVRAIDELEPGQHAQRYTAVHEVLQSALADTDLRETR